MPLKLLTRGEASAYGVLGLVDWRGPETPEAAREAYLAEFPDQRGDFRFRSAEFAAWLVGNGIAAEVACAELHVETFGQIGKWWEKPLRRCEKP